jgi:hypothetical protein
LRLASQIGIGASYGPAFPFHKKNTPPTAPD